MISIRSSRASNGDACSCDGRECPHGPLSYAEPRRTCCVAESRRCAATYCCARHYPSVRPDTALSYMAV